jgi:threonine dehydratase
MRTEGAGRRRPHADVAQLKLSDIAAARAAIRDRVHTTPLLSARTLSEQVGTEVLLKAELFQRTGSFKTRGAFTKLLRLSPEQRSRGVVAVSSGNHAQAVAYCAERLRIPCVAVMWPSVSPQKLAATRSYGATVDLEAADGVEAIDRATMLADARGLTPIPAYDDLDVIAGQGTLGLEILDQHERVDAVLVPVSGGGLLAGVAVSVKATRSRARIIAVEPESSPALTSAFAAGHPVYVHHDSIADGLGAPEIGTLCFEVAAPLVDAVVTVTDEQIVAAMQWLFHYAKLAVEPAGAVTTAALLAGKVDGGPGEAVVAIVSGGNVDLAQAAEYLAVGRPG